MEEVSTRSPHEVVLAGTDHFHNGVRKVGQVMGLLSVDVVTQLAVADWAHVTLVEVLLVFNLDEVAMAAALLEPVPPNDPGTHFDLEVIHSQSEEEEEHR